MEQKEFLNLLKKYNQSKCSENELQLLFKFCKELQVDDVTQSWSLLEEEEEKIAILQRINQTIAANKNTKRTKIYWKKLQPVAAILIALISVSYFYLQTSSSSEPNYPQNLITLELQDGTVKVIEEDGAVNIVDKNGNMVGQQKGSILVYKKNKESFKLVYNTLTVPYGKKFDLQLSDGTTVHLNAGSSLKYPVQFLEGDKRQVFITGEAYLDVAKDTKHPFIVNAYEMNIRVLGTQFNVSAYPEDNEIDIVLVEGSVSLYTGDEPYHSDKATLLKPGYKASFDKVDKSITKDRVLTNIYTSWRNGELVFRNMSFGNILKKLERHYDVTIVNNNQELSKEKFNASFGKVSIDKVFENLKKYHGINSTMEGNKIIIE